MGQIYAQTQGWEQLRQQIQKACYSSLFILADEHTHRHCVPRVLEHLPEGQACEILELEPGEDSKDPAVLYQLWESLTELEADRHSLLINVGGGVVTDLGGFLAATYLRGIDFINCPTSLLAMVDAASGGKTGINLGKLKNRVGAFAWPLFTVLDDRFLNSLPLKERRAGYAEMLKHALIASPAHWQELVSIEDTYLPPIDMIQRSLELKLNLVQADPREQHQRKALNFGHTLGHALETESHRRQKPLLHGEAVALGMWAELELAEPFAGLPSDEKIAIQRVIEKHFGALIPDWPLGDALTHVKADKKNRAGEQRYSLISTIGEPRLDVVVPAEQANAALEKLSAHV